MKCLTCKHLDLKSNDKMARLGFGKCKLDKEAWRYVSFRFERVCKTLEPVTDAVAKKRTDWASQK
ncbi:hypothetical protein C7W93_15275 [Glaciimonas sp. PCH181]|nr:hypothetical protein C7W93_15275 [Glaciimonas sp. PCH181]